MNYRPHTPHPFALNSVGNDGGTATNSKAAAVARTDSSPGTATRKSAATTAEMPIACSGTCCLGIAAAGSKGSAADWGTFSCSGMTGNTHHPSMACYRCTMSSSRHSS